MRKNKIGIKPCTILGYYFTITLTWMIAFFFLLTFQMNQYSSLSIMQLEHINSTMLSGVIAGFIWGTIFKIAQKLKAHIPLFFLSILVSVLVNISSAYLLIYSMYNLGGLFTFSDFPQNFSQLIDLYNSQLFYTILIYFFIVGTLIEIFHDIDKKLGKGILIKFLLGRYYKPKEEERIFLFMDLKSSTYYAEKLGHFKYSRLIQDCFKDISSSVMKNNAEVYQFVGDEVVLTWKLEKGIEQLRCVKLFYDFLETIDKKKEYYQTNYGMIPVFKAGIHSGKVMVAEVGELKSEIAYHGDAINTASRIQGLCNNYNSRLLVSGDLLKELKQKNELSLQVNFIAKVLLAGKEQSTNLYTFSSN